MNSSASENSRETRAEARSNTSSNNNNSNNSGNSQQNIRRAVRQLRRSGRRLVPREDGWTILSYGRPVGSLSAEEVAFLAAEGHVVEATGGGFVIASATTDEATSAPDIPVTGAWVFAAAGCPVSRAPGRGFEKLAHKARNGDGPLSLRQVEAGLRLIADAECAARRSGLTMDWSNTVVDRQRRRGSDGGLTFGSRAAARRLHWILKVIGGEPFAIAWRVCVERRSIQKLAADLGVRSSLAVKQLAQALEEIAEAYDASG